MTGASNGVPLILLFILMIGFISEAASDRLVTPPKAPWVNPACHGGRIVWGLRVGGTNCGGWVTQAPACEWMCRQSQRRKMNKLQAFGHEIKAVIESFWDNPYTYGGSTPDAFHIQSEIELGTAKVYLMAGTWSDEAIAEIHQIRRQSIAQGVNPIPRYVQGLLDGRFVMHHVVDDAGLKRKFNTKAERDNYCRQSQSCGNHTRAREVVEGKPNLWGYVAPPAEYRAPIGWEKQQAEIMASPEYQARMEARRQPPTN